MDRRLVVGLGNPGREYAGTRHNIGWMAMDRLREKNGWPEFVPEADGAVEVCRAPAAKEEEGGPEVWLVKPMLYMNRSGQALVRWLDRHPEFGLDEAARAAWPSPYFINEETGEWCWGTPWGGKWRDDVARPALSRMLVVVDDIHLPLGRVRLRPRGSDGGHNGLTDIARVFGAEDPTKEGLYTPLDEYPRLRVGVGKPPEGVDRVAWVLGGFEGEDAERLPTVVDFAAEAAADWAREGLDAARSRYNGKDGLGA